MARIDEAELMIAIAHLWARRSTCKRAQVGAVIAREGRSVASGYNGAPPGMLHCTEAGCDEGPAGGCRRATHAEANAVAFAARHGVRTEGAEMWCTHSPCLACAQVMIAAGIRAVHYASAYRDPLGMRLLAGAGVELFAYDRDEER